MDWKIILNGRGEKRGQIYIGDNHTKQILNRKGELLGYYHTSADKTFDAHGHYVGPGDQRMSLLDDACQ